MFRETSYEVVWEEEKNGEKKKEKKMRSRYVEEISWRKTERAKKGRRFWGEVFREYEVVWDEEEKRAILEKKPS